eukprot:jgi/Mesvir1/19010/Mv12778-RA.1
MQYPRMRKIKAAYKQPIEVGRAQPHHMTVIAGKKRSNAKSEAKITPVSNQTSPATNAAEKQPEAPVYIVKPGDTLGVIARTCGKDVDELCKINNIPNPNSIKVGDKILLGDGTSGAAPQQRWDSFRAALFKQAMEKKKQLAAKAQLQGTATSTPSPATATPSKATATSPSTAPATAQSNTAKDPVKTATAETSANVWAGWEGPIALVRQVGLPGKIALGVLVAILAVRKGQAWMRRRVMLEQETGMELLLKEDDLKRRRAWWQQVVESDRDGTTVEGELPAGMDTDIAEEDMELAASLEEKMRKEYQRFLKESNILRKPRNASENDRRFEN